MSVRSAAIWAMASQYMVFATTFVASIYLARYWIGPKELGLFSIAFAATSLIAVLQDFGLTRYIAGEAELTPEKIRTSFSLSLVIAWLIGLVSIGLAWPMAVLYDQPKLIPLMAVIGASYLIVPLAIVPTALRQRAMDFKSNTMIEVGAALANAGVSVHLARQGYGAVALAWGAFAQQAARAAISQWRNGFLFPWPMRFTGARPVVLFGGGSSLLVLSGSVGGRIPDLVLGRLVGEAALGLFARAAGLATQLRTLVSGAAAGVFYPAFARVRDSGQPLGPPYLRVVASYCAVTWPAMAGLAVVAEPLIRLIYGEHWIGAAPLLQWAALSQICFVALPLHVELPILLGKMGRLIRLNMLDTLVSIALLAAGAWFNLEAAAASRLAYGVVWIAIYAGFLRSIAGFEWRAMLVIYLRSAVATFAAVAPLLLIMASVGPVGIGFATMLVGTGAGIVAWFGTLWLCRHPAFEEIKAILGPVLHKLHILPA